MHACMRACVHARVRGCAGAWVRGCVGAWVRGCVGAWVRGCVGVWVCGCVGVWVCGCVGVWVWALNARAEIMDSLKSLGPEEQLRHLKMRFAQELVDGAKGEEEREIRLSTLLAMVEERGGKLSRTKEKLFSSSEPSPAKEVPKPVVSEPVGSSEVATAKAKPSEPEPRESATSGAVPSLSGALANPSSPTGAESLLASLAEQTKAVAEALEKSKGREQRPRSTIQISPKVTWPVLDDDFTDHKSVTDSYDQFESTVHLANDGQGMSET